MENLSRRAFVAGAVGTAALAGHASSAVANTSPRRLRPAISSEPFTLGVASGDPLSNAVVIWTRLAPEPTVDGGAWHRPGPGHEPPPKSS